MMGNVDVEGLVGELQEHFCEGDVPVDAQHALGAAFNVLGLVSSNRAGIPRECLGVEQYAVDRDLNKNSMFFSTVAVKIPLITLVGPPRCGGRLLVWRTDRFLAQVKGAPPPVWCGFSPRDNSEHSPLSVWDGPSRTPNSDQLLISGNNVQRVHTPRDATPLVRKVRDFLSRKRWVRVRLDVVADQAYRGLCNIWLKEALTCKPETAFDHSARIERWANIASLLAIGVDPDEPIITYSMLDLALNVAVVEHDLLRGHFNSPEFSGPPRLTVVQ